MDARRAKSPCAWSTGKRVVVVKGAKTIVRFQGQERSWSNGSREEAKSSLSWVSGAGTRLTGNQTATTVVHGSVLVEREISKTSS